MASRCDSCGKFARVTYPVPCNPPSNGIDHEVCEPCGRYPGSNAMGLPTPTPEETR